MASLPRDYWWGRVLAAWSRWTAYHAGTMPGFTDRISYARARLRATGGGSTRLL